MSNPIRRFTRALRAQGFKLAYRSRAGGCVVTEFSKRVGDRELTVQLWDSGDHRVSHGTHNENGLRSTTVPTSFWTVEHMLTAIEYEWIRPSTEVEY